jgi:hypothetical protein
MPDVTQEVWTWDEGGGFEADPNDASRMRRIVNQVHIRLDLPEPPPNMAYAEDDVLLFAGKGGERRGAGDLAKARARMAARAPTYFRLLETVLQLGITIPVELADVIQTNLHRAAPEKYAMPPERGQGPRKTSWEKLLDEDLV